MTRETFKLVMAIGVLLNSALYLTGCLAIGIVLQQPWAWRLALAALGATYLSYVFHFATVKEGDGLHTAAIYLVFTSVALGAAAGIVLLFG